MLKPIEDKVIIKPSEAESVTTSGLILALSKDETPDEGIVLAVGPGIVFPNGQKLILDVSVGNKVFFSKFAATEVEHDGEKLLIVPYKDILAVLDATN